MGSSSRDGRSVPSRALPAAPTGLVHDLRGIDLPAPQAPTLRSACLLSEPA